MVDGTVRIETVLAEDAAVPLSDAQREQLGGGVRIPLAGTVNGTGFRTTAFRMGGFTGVAFNKKVLAAAGVAPGDQVVVELHRDTAAREVELPAELVAVLAGDAAATAAYEALSFTHRREYAEWVGGAKKAATRERRAAEALERVRAGRPPR